MSKYIKVPEETVGFLIFLWSVIIIGITGMVSLVLFLKNIFK
jgi:hypothetical protein